jgi:phospholipase/carboxylesterase
MSGELLDAVEIATADSASLAVIWLHGLGADGHDFVPIARELALPFGVRFVFPHAPARPVTINGGFVMRAWFDLLSLERTGPVDEAGIRASAAAVERLIARERANGFPSDRIVVAGFSQGGAIALHAALRHAEPLAGILALSTYLPLAASLGREHAPANRSVPIWLGHGTDDPVIRLELAKASRDELTAAGYSVEWHAYAMAHSVCPEEIADMRAWLTRIEACEA